MTHPPGQGPPGSWGSWPNRGAENPQRPVPPPGGHGPYGAPPNSYSPYPSGHPGYGQQAGPRYPYGGPGGFQHPPQPPGPRKGRAALWASLSLLAVGIVTFLVTGLLAPGFLLDEQRGTAPVASDGRFTTPKELAVALVDGVNRRDTQALRSLTCTSADEGLDEDIAHLAEFSDASLTLVRRTSPSTAVARLTLTLNGERVQMLSDLRRTHGLWCWQNWKPADDLTTI